VIALHPTKNVLQLDEYLIEWFV